MELKGNILRNKLSQNKQTKRCNTYILKMANYCGKKFKRSNIASSWSAKASVVKNKDYLFTE